MANSATILPGCGHTRRIPKPFARFERLEILLFSPLITLCLSGPFLLAAQSRREELEVLPGLGVLGPEPAGAPSFVLSTLCVFPCGSRQIAGPSLAGRQGLRGTSPERRQRSGDSGGSPCFGPGPQRARFSVHSNLCSRSSGSSSGSTRTPRSSKRTWTAASASCSASWPAISATRAWRTTSTS